MIRVTKLNGAEHYVNCDKIETIDTAPDTMLCLDNGKRLVVLESPEEIVERIIEYRTRMYTELPTVRKRVVEE